MTVPTVTLAEGLTVSAQGYGAMSVAPVYGPVDPAEALATLCDRLAQERFVTVDTELGLFAVAMSMAFLAFLLGTMLYNGLGGIDMSFLTGSDSTEAADAGGGADAAPAGALAAACGHFVHVFVDRHSRRPAPLPARRRRAPHRAPRPRSTMPGTKRVARWTTALERSGTEPWPATPVATFLVPELNFCHVEGPET